MIQYRDNHEEDDCITMIPCVFIYLVFSLMTVRVFGARDLDWSGSGEVDDSENHLRQLSIIAKTTEQSSTYSKTFPSNKAADGNFKTGVAITKKDVNPYWKVDLGEKHCIGKVTVYNRADCCSIRLREATVRAGVENVVKLNERCGQQVTPEQARPRGGIVEFFCDPPLVANVVSVDIPRTEYLQIQEVLVEEYPMGRCNRVERRLSILHEVTEQSSTYNQHFISDLAADGYLGNRGMAITGKESDPWWRVILKEGHCINKVTIYNRDDHCSGRLANAVVKAGMSDDIAANAQCGAQLTADQVKTHGGIYDFYCGPPLRARYVSVDIPGRVEYLQLREVEIEELDADPCENDEWDLSIIGRPTKQSSYFDPRLSPDKAADGNRDTRLSPQFLCAHTQVEIDPWWLVDLEGVHCISRVFVVNRGDCCSERLTKAVIRAGTNADFHSNTQCGNKVTSDQASVPGGTIEFKCRPPGVEARYISVDIPFGKPQYLQLCEVTVKELVKENACHPPESEEEVVITTRKPLPKKVVGGNKPQQVPHGAGP